MMNYFSVQLLPLACVSHAHGHSPHPPKHMRCTETVCKYAQVIPWVNEFHFLINSLYKSEGGVSGVYVWHSCFNVIARPCVFMCISQCSYI